MAGVATEQKVAYRGAAPGSDPAAAQWDARASVLVAQQGQVRGQSGPARTRLLAAAAATAATPGRAAAAPAASRPEPSPPAAGVVDQAVRSQLRRAQQDLESANARRTSPTRRSSTPKTPTQQRDDSENDPSGYRPQGGPPMSGFAPGGLAPTWSNLEQMYVDAYGELPSPQSLQLFAAMVAQRTGAGPPSPGLFPPGFPQV